MSAVVAWKGLGLAIAYFWFVWAMVDDYVTDGERRQNGE